MQLLWVELTRVVKFQGFEKKKFLKLVFDSFNPALILENPFIIFINEKTSSLDVIVIDFSV